jgi:hypothetical protein
MTVGLSEETNTHWLRIKGGSQITNPYNKHLAVSRKKRRKLHRARPYIKLPFAVQLFSLGRVITFLSLLGPLSGFHLVHGTCSKS